MYSPIITGKRMTKMADYLRQGYDPNFSFVDYTVGDVEQRVEELDAIYDMEEKKLLRPLTPDEEKFVTHEIVRSKIDAVYWMNRYAKIKTKKQTLERLKFTAVQERLMAIIGKCEEDALGGVSGDGILLAVLKARQLGVSTISEAIICHRVFYYNNTTALIAADIDERSAHLFDMTERVYANLPWWLRPEYAYHVKDKQLYFDKQDSLIKVGSSKNMQGGDSGQAKGSIGTGQTIPLAHLSEIALWENPQQIDDALMPSIPEFSRTFAIFESTAKGRGNWWHNSWLTAKKGLGRRRPVFIPWYTDPNTYTRPAPVNWEPSEIALAHAKRVVETSPRWCGKTVDLTRDQLYWWEMTRAYHIEDRKLHVFLAEYAADDEEAFQNTTMSVFPPELLHDMRQHVSEPRGLFEILPRTQLQ